MNLMLESELCKILRNNLEKNDYIRVFKKIKEAESVNVETVPIGFIKAYAESHGAICKCNLLNMIDNYRHSLNCGGENGEKQS